MDLLICLWKYDNRWVFELKFFKSIWLLGSIFQSIILITSIVIGLNCVEVRILIGTRIVVCLGSIIACSILAFEQKSNNKVRLWTNLQIFVALMSLINFFLTWNLNSNTESSVVFRQYTTIQVLLYVLALTPAIINFAGCLLVKTIYISLALLVPSFMIKIRNR
jgi:hypothetical protein